MFSEIIAALVLILISGYASAIEIAIASFGKNRIEELKEKDDKKARIFEAIQKDPNYFFGTIQIITTLCLLAAAILTFLFFINLLNPILKSSEILVISVYSQYISFILGLIVVSFLTIVLGILVPKAVGYKYSEKIGKSSVKFALVLTSIFKFPVKLVTNISNFIILPIKEKTDFSQTRFSEDEIRIIISEGVKTGAIDETEHEIIENIFEFNDLHANEVMIPRTEMIAIEMIDEVDELVKEIVKINHSLIPVYKDSIDNITGVLHTKDFMKSFISGNPVIVKSLIRPAYFVPETKLISEILKEMQNRGERLAIVTDEYGGTEGVITIEDILEEIVGDIWDNTKVEVKDYSKLQDGKYYILGSITIEDFNDSFNVKIPVSDEYNTLAGFVADKSGKILNNGEVFEYGDLVFELIKKIRQKMVQFRVYSKKDGFFENENEA
jgi:putative hemolysin